MHLSSTTQLHTFYINSIGLFKSSIEPNCGDCQATHLHHAQTAPSGSITRFKRNHSNLIQLQLAVFFLGIDRFKTINDTLGHMVGDELLKEVAARIKLNIRKLSVVAEGVETEQQLSLLRSSGCDEIQGYLGSHPLPSGEYEIFMKSAGSLRTH